MIYYLLENIIMLEKQNYMDLILKIYLKYYMDIGKRIKDIYLNLKIKLYIKIIFT